MEGPLENGTRLKTVSSTVITVDRYLAEGGQGYVYIVDYGGEKKALSAVGQVMSKKSTGELYIRNKTDRRWEAVTTKGVARKVAPEENIPLKNGITFTIYGEKITIRSN